MCRILFLVVLVFKIFAAFAIAAVPTTTMEKSCENGWIPYKDEKCLQINSEDFLNYSSAVAYCNSMDTTDGGSSLLSIRNEQEQTDFYNLIFNTANIQNNLWLGLQKTNGSYTWPDGSQLEFGNWINTTKSNSQCVEINTEGKWLAVSCSRRNMFVCEKRQTWSLYKIQKSLQQFEKAIQQQLEKAIQQQLEKSIQQQLEKSIKQQLEKSIQQQLESCVPTGFIYVQLSGQPDPKAMWPALKWEDITSKYAGLFFRAEGPESARYNGGAQADNAPRLTRVQSDPMKGNGLQYVDIVIGGYTQRLQTGASTSSDNYYSHIFFLHSGGEVRPRNEAVRIWVRI